MIISFSIGEAIYGKKFLCVLFIALNYNINSLLYSKCISKYLGAAMGFAVTFTTAC